jgi:glucose-1-phosphate thymidylyltransferase
MKGILLAGGTGSRLFPITNVISKQLLPIFDKPMVYYPLTTLMLAGIMDILILSTPIDTPIYQRLLGDGSKWGINIQYCVQEKPAGIAQCFILGKDFIGNDSCSLILGDNIFHGAGLTGLLSNAMLRTSGATVFGYTVSDPERYGVIEIDKDNRAISIEEKPSKPKSHFAVTGLYFYDNDVVSIAEGLKPSPREELEITDVNMEYLKRKSLHVELMDAGYNWLDTGTFHSMMQASNFIQMMEERQGIKIGCPEEIAYHKGYITKEQLLELARPMSGNNYGKYLINL